jgi:anti-sigma-K factor RskA
MISERHEELATLHALGLLEGVERHAFEAELAGNRELRELVAALDATCAQLAFAAPAQPPPPGLKADILAALPAPAPAPVTPFSFSRYLPWAAAAVFALTATWLSTQYVSLRSENDALRTQQRLAELAFQAARNQLAERSLLAESMIRDLGNRLRRSEDLARLKVSALASLAGNTKEAQAIAVWDPDQQAGLLTFDRLPTIPESQDYQIWVVAPDHPNPVNGGVFKPDADGHAVLAFKPDQPVAKAAAFAISLEKKGGVPKAEGPIVLLGKVPGI